LRPALPQQRFTAERFSISSSARSPRRSRSTWWTSRCSQPSSPARDSCASCRPCGTTSI
jgi:hypothetical protein